MRHCQAGLVRGLSADTDTRRSGRYAPRRWPRHIGAPQDERPSPAEDSVHLTAMQQAGDNYLLGGAQLAFPFRRGSANASDPDTLSAQTTLNQAVESGRPAVPQAFPDESVRVKRGVRMGHPPFRC